MTELSDSSLFINLNSTADFSEADRTSYQLISENGKYTYATSLDAQALPGLNSLRTVKDFVTMLDALGVPGPLTLAMNRKRLGEGAQFEVWSGSLLDSGNCEYHTDLQAVAVKKCRFRILENQKIDLSSNTSRGQVHDMYLEVAALRQNGLRGHRNIIKLLGWGVEENYFEMPLLVLELAIADLETIFRLEKYKERLSSDILQQLSIDVGQGLDAIHQAGIIHGDLKPANVLVCDNFSSTVPYIGCLADFGLSVSEIRDTVEDKVKVTGRSVAWCAPEVDIGADLSTSQLIKADNFSYGLLIFSVMCLQGQQPKSKKCNVILETIRSKAEIPPTIRCLLESSCILLLDHNFCVRPFLVGDVLRDDSDSYKAWCEDVENHNRLQKEEEEQESKEALGHQWRLPPLAPFLVQGLDESYKRYRTWMTGPQIFAAFLFKTYVDIKSEDNNLQLQMLEAAANVGHVPAQCMLGRVQDSYNVHHEVQIASLFAGASTGSFIALQDLKARDATSARTAQEAFRNSMGYNQFYSPINTVTGQGPAPFQDGNTQLHVLASLGDFQSLEALLLTSGTSEINATNFRGETVLLKACMTGCWQTVKMLCNHGADASISGGINNLTPLHWLFNFPDEDVDLVAEVLVKAMANCDALADAYPAMPLYHFPFSWPSGSPLHYAVFTNNLLATRALLKLGARPEMRNGRDPYLTDENVRQNHHHGNSEQGEYSEPRPDQLPMGFSCADLAAALHLPGILKCLQEHRPRNGPNLLQVDEEGYDAFHRLSYYRIARTYHGSRFWFLAFRGNTEGYKKRLAETIQTLQSMGGDIDRLTATPSSPAIPGVSGLSPLMIAVTKADVETAEALLDCGADVNLVNRDGYSALTLLAHSEDPGVAPGALENLTALFIRYKAHINHQTQDGSTALSAAVASESLDTIDLLLDAGANPAQSRQGLNLIAILILSCSSRAMLDPPMKSHVVMDRREEMLEKLLRKLELGSQQSTWAQTVDLDNGSLLHYACKAGLPKLVAVLVEAGLDINTIRRAHEQRVDEPVNGSYHLKAKMMHIGTALDVVRQEQKSFVDSERNRISTDDTHFVLRKLAEVEKILLSRGARTAESVSGD